jgi:large subunit ribosomal protein L30
MAKETKKETKKETRKVKIQWYRSAISTPEKHKVIVRSLGLTRLNQVVERPDTPEIRGMVAKIPHLLRIVE